MGTGDPFKRMYLIRVIKVNLMLHNYCNVSSQGKCEQSGSRDVDLVFQGHQWVIFTWFMFGSHAFYFVQCFVPTHPSLWRAERMLLFIFSFLVPLLLWRL